MRRIKQVCIVNKILLTVHMVMNLGVVLSKIMANTDGIRLVTYW